ncbi:RNA polymerase sigma factor [Sphingobacterium faecale]|uniref:Sigma-70 family RNA polymerase sigma factor n=1 Tax=Sphingobacterium faecale TaxID=2803775 RepID=A0ABS1R8P4_9SPHI|nr:sigma-70 family RNA polymerase sigma factor [Sphingobacterium faecale]MBL1410362.1 sigma-70 family RNA polymerase sigma factor [Sphingobacterium faecale]
MNSHSEYHLLTRIREGDHSAFEKIYDTHKIQLTASVLRLLRSSELAEEVIQETFVTLWETRERIDDTKPLQPYLYTIAANKTKNIFRKSVSDLKVRDELLTTFEESYTPIMDSIFRKEYASLVDSLLSKLTPQQATVYRLCKLENKSYQEVSRLLGIAEGTVNVHIREANRTLRDLIANRPDLLLLLITFFHFS